MICSHCGKQIGKNEVGYVQNCDIFYKLTAIKDIEGKLFLQYDEDDVNSHDGGTFYHRRDLCDADLFLSEGDVISIMGGVENETGG